jgi:DNA-binding GntR family transcriptional regulator
VDLIRVDTQYAYNCIREKISTLVLKPGSPINEGELAEELEIGLTPVREALKLLYHDHLIDAPPRGLFVTEIEISDLEQISEIRTLLEPFCAQKAATRATPDDFLVLEALCKEQIQMKPNQYKEYFELDHKFHQSIARAAGNKFLANILDDFYGLSQRIWFLALPSLEFLPAAVSAHIEIVNAIKNKDGDRAEEIMRDHITAFYERIINILEESEVIN